jgi:RHS repeat-associated protein
MVWDGFAWFGALSANVAVAVNGTNNSQFISQTVPATMSSAQSYPVSVTLQNSGTSTWAPGSYFLGSENPQANTTWGPNRVELAAPVAPGASVTLNFNVTAPSAGGTYNFQWRMVQNSTRFGAFTTNVAVNVQQAQAMTLYYVHADHLNTPRLVTNQAQQAVWRWDQVEPFGINVPDENPSGLGAFDLPLRLPGQYYDKETNLAYNMARDYDPVIGRYIQSDPIGLGGGINTYVYVLDPLTQIDPEGLMGRAPGTFGKPGGPSSSTPAVPSAAPISCDGEWKQRGHDEQLPKTFRLCTCYWLCIPCDRPVIWSGNKRDLPSTGGQLFYDSIGGAVRTGNRCICTNKPGPEKSCKPCQQSGAQ